MIAYSIAASADGPLACVVQRDEQLGISGRPSVLLLTLLAISTPESSRPWKDRPSETGRTLVSISA